jgi:TatD DNase family protein
MVLMIDSHLHGIEAVPENYSDFSELTRMVSCVAKVDEWDKQIAIEDPRMIKSYGVHPWYAEDWTLENKKRLFDLLSSDPNAHVGEIGLDSKRGQILGQTMVLIQQLDIAEYFGRVVSIHDVGCEKMVLDTLKGRNLKGIILHSYGSDSYVKPYSEMGCYFSISPRLLSRSDIRVKRLMEAIPDDRLLLETDSPACGKEFKGMRDFSERLGSIIGRPSDELLSLAEENLRRLFP